MRKFIIPGFLALALAGASTIAVAQTQTDTAPAPEAPAAQNDQSGDAPVTNTPPATGGDTMTPGAGTNTAPTTGGADAAAATAPGTSTIAIADAENWIGKRVYANDGSDIGEISAFKGDVDGKVSYFHTDIGGFLGIGETSVQVTPAQFQMRGEKLYLDMTKDEAMKLPRVTE